MKIFKILVLFITFISIQALANTDRKIENEGVMTFIIDRIKESLINKNAFIFNPKITDIEIKIDTKYVKKLPFDSNQIDNLSITEINKMSSSFKGEVTINNGNNENFKEVIQGRYIENVEIPALKKRMKAGYIIEKDDIEFIHLDAKKINHDIVSNLEELIGKTPRYSIAAHIPINREVLSNPNIVNKNDLVTVIYQKDNIELKMIGIAMEAGAVGDTIKVQNTKSNSVLHGIIEDNKFVRVH